MKVVTVVKVWIIGHAQDSSSLAATTTTSKLENNNEQRAKVRNPHGGRTVVEAAEAAQSGDHRAWLKSAFTVINGGMHVPFWNSSKQITPGKMSAYRVHGPGEERLTFDSD